MAFPSQPTRPSYGLCDSFFVESDNDAWFERKQAERDHARQQARLRQQSLAGELSRITSNQYRNEILEQMEYMEGRTGADVNSIDIQTEIQWYMRPYLLDFLVEAHSAFSLLPDTLYLTVNLLDRYCSRRVVYKRHYQLVGCAALLIAAKYGDRKERVPQIKELKAMCCSLYEEDMFTQMEWHLLQTLDWEIGHPTIDSFLQIAMSDGTYCQEVEHMSWYITELALFHKEFVSTLPSAMARAALSLSRFILSVPSKPSMWADNYDPCLVGSLYAYLQQPSTVVAKKYSAYQLSAVSVTAQMFIERQAQIELEKRRQTAPPTPPIEVGGPWYMEKPRVDSALGPQTPQKRSFVTMTNTGLYTPPITPENENSQYAQHQQPHPHTRQNTLPPMLPATPTPPSSIDNHPLKYYQSAYELPQDQRYWVT